MNTYLYIAVMALTTYTIRVLPLTLIRKPIKSTFLRSFLYYVPYVTLAVMTFPAILEATDSPMIGGLAMLVGIVSAWLGFRFFAAEPSSHCNFSSDLLHRYTKAAGEDAGGLRVLQLLGQSAFSSAYCFSQIRRIGKNPVVPRRNMSKCVYKMWKFIERI